MNAGWPRTGPSSEPISRQHRLACSRSAAGRLGGFVPMLESAGYQATGIDPEAPTGSSYRQVEFESYEAPGPVDAVVASASLHHVADLAVVLDQVNALLVPAG